MQETRRLNLKQVKVLIEEIRNREDILSKWLYNPDFCEKVQLKISLLFEPKEEIQSKLHRVRQDWMECLRQREALRTTRFHLRKQVETAREVHGINEFINEEARIREQLRELKELLEEKPMSQQDEDNLAIKVRHATEPVEAEVRLGREEYQILQQQQRQLQQRLQEVRDQCATLNAKTFIEIAPEDQVILESFQL